MDSVGQAAAGIVGMLLSVGLALLPVVFALWVIAQLRSMSRDMTLLRRQLGAIAEHSGATVVAEPADRGATRTPLWMFAVVLALFLFVLAVLSALPVGQGSGVMEFESESGDSGTSTGSATVPMPEPRTTP